MSIHGWDGDTVEPSMVGSRSRGGSATPVDTDCVFLEGAGTPPTGWLLLHTADWNVVTSST